MTHFRAVLTKVRSHITGNVVAYLALFVALGGTSYGLATGSIDSRELKNNTVRTGDLRNNDIRSRDIRNRTIVGRDLLSNTLGGDQIDETELGKIPLATRAESADNALALGGQPASAFAVPPVANTIDVDDGNAGTALIVPGFGTLRVISCNAVMDEADFEWLNSSGVAQDWWTTVTAYFSVPPSSSSTDFTFVDSGQLRIGQQGTPARMVTITVYLAEVPGNECRISSQAVTSG